MSFHFRVTHPHSFAATQCSATVVVMMDNHFNPSVSDQCISRAHRYGQVKPVRCFRLAIEGTTEEKVYNRSVNKKGVAMQVIDGKFSEKLFAAAELDDLQESNITATCDKCQKKRLLPPSQDPPAEDEPWYCHMNSDPSYNNCRAPEQGNLKKHARAAANQVITDPMLQHLIGIINPQTRKSEIVTDFFPVEIAHATDTSCEDATSKLKRDIAAKIPGLAKSFEEKPTKETSIARKVLAFKAKPLEYLSKIKMEDETDHSELIAAFKPQSEMNSLKERVKERVEPEVVDLTLSPVKKRPRGESWDSTSPF